MNTNDALLNLVEQFGKGSDRRDLQKRRWDLLRDNVRTHVEAAIRGKFKDPDNVANYITYMDLSNNCYKYIIRRLASVYKEGPSRSFEEATDTKLFKEKVEIEELDILMEQVNRLALALNEVFVKPVLRDNMIEFDIVLPQNCEVISNGTAIESIIYPTEVGVLSYWDKGFNIFVTENGDIISKKKNPYGVVPFITFRKERPVNGFWVGQEGEELVEAYFHQVINRTWLQIIAYFQSHKQLAREVEPNEPLPRGTPAVRQSIGPASVLKGKHTVLDLNTRIKDHFDVIEGKLMRTASNYGIGSESYSHSKMSSGLERLISQASLNEKRKEQIKIFRPADKRLMKLACLIWNIDGEQGKRFSDNPLPKINYAEPEIIDSGKDEMLLLELKVQMGVVSPVDYMMRKDPDIQNREEAKKLLARNLSEYQEVLKMKQSFQQPKEAEVTGKEGGQLSGEIRENKSEAANLEKQTEEENMNEDLDASKEQ